MSKAIPNSFQVPNAIVDELLCQMSPTAVKCYLLIVRKTLGWQKTEDSIALSQFKKFTGAEKSAVNNAVNWLENMDLIRRDFRDGKTTTYKINLSPTLPSERTGGSTQMEGGVHSDGLGVPFHRTGGSTQTDRGFHLDGTTKPTNTKPTNTKPNITKDPPQHDWQKSKEEFETPSMRHFLDMYPRNPRYKSEFRKQWWDQGCEDIAEQIMANLGQQLMLCAEYENAKFMPVAEAYLSDRKWENKIVERQVTQTTARSAVVVADMSGLEDRQ